MSFQCLIHGEISTTADAIHALLRVEFEHLEQAALAADSEPALLSVPRNATQTHIVWNGNLNEREQRERAKRLMMKMC